jgi:phage terminase large subunit GpA-like protein
MPRRKPPPADVPVIDTEEKLEILRANFFEALQPEEPLDYDEWADKYRVLTSDSSAEYGQWKTSRFPFLKKIMKALSPSNRAQKIVFVKPAQVGGTELATGWLLYGADVYPGPIIYTQGTSDATEEYSKQRLRVAIEACKKVEYKLGSKKNTRFADSWDNKQFPGGFINLGGANSTSFLKSKPIRWAVADEVDEYNLNVGKQGNPLSLLIKRMNNFPDRKLFMLSTPVLAELSLIWPAYEAGSQELYYLPCPHCNSEADKKGFMFFLDWDHIEWSEEKTVEGYPRDVWAVCPNCGEKIYEGKHKTWMLENGEWFSTVGSDGATVERYMVGDVFNPSFRINGLYSPYGFYSWHDAVNEWHDYLKTKRVELLQVFINQTLAQTFKLEGQEINYNWLHSRRESYATGSDTYDVPEGVLVLTAGVDIQDDRIEVEVKGHGLFEETWGIDYKVLPGDTSQKGDKAGILQNGQPSVWRLLDEYLARRWKHACGVDMFIEVTMIDAGYKAEEVHTFCRLREHRRIYPVHGVPGWGKGLWTVNRQRHKTYRTVFYTAYVDELKNKLYAQLQVTDPGPGYQHFPSKDCYSEKYFKGLTCETRETKMVGGRKRLYWKTPPGARNEPIDITNYNRVALLAYGVDLNTRAQRGLASLFNATTDSAGVPASTRRRRKVLSRGL